VVSQLPLSVQKRLVVTKLQWLYRLYPRFQHLLPFIPLALWLTRLPNCRVLLSSSSAFAKGFRKPPGAVHLNYCHTPTRFLWSDVEYITQEVPAVVRWLARVFLWWMKRWDLRAAAGVDVFLSNSKEVQGRIQKYYGRGSEIVYPFVDTDFWQPVAHMATRNYFLLAGRLHAHKHNDLVIKVCTKLELPLHVVGTGRDEAHLKSVAGPSVTFLGRVTDAELRKEFSNARAYIYPQLEDFGLMPVEAAACGTPSIGLNVGGSRETIIPGVTGEWFSEGNEDELARLLRHWQEDQYSTEKLRAHAMHFSKERFCEAIRKAVEECVATR
jgi:glycosyltransferase involved in cell wall biosynthesis